MNSLRWSGSGRLGGSHYPSTMPAVRLGSRVASDLLVARRTVGPTRVSPNKGKHTARPPFASFEVADNHLE